MQLIIKNQQEMIDFASQVAGKIITKKFYNQIFALNGEVGSGKTFFVNALINKLAKIYFNNNSEKTKELENNNINVLSPSFNLLYHYQIGDIEIVHCDLYRLDKESEKLYQELENIGLFDYIGNKLIFIEWADIAKKFLPRNIYNFDFSFSLPNCQENYYENSRDEDFTNNIDKIQCRIINFDDF